MMNKAILMIAVLALSACQPRTPAEPPLAGAKIGGPFSLISEDGKPVSEKDFAGQYRLIYFGYTFCPDVCPVDVQNLMLGFKALEASNEPKAAKIQPLFITIDPARDTPAVLTQFTNAFHQRLIGLTGTDAQIAATAKIFAVLYAKREASSPTAYLMDHSRTAILFGPQGAPLAIIPQDGKPADIAAALERWVQ